MQVIECDWCKEKIGKNKKYPASMMPYRTMQTEKGRLDFCPECLLELAKIISIPRKHIIEETPKKMKKKTDENAIQEPRLCTKCRKNEAVPGRKQCKACQERQNRLQKEYLAREKAKKQKAEEEKPQKEEVKPKKKAEPQKREAKQKTKKPVTKREVMAMIEDDHSVEEIAEKFGSTNNEILGIVTAVRRGLM